MLKSLSVQNYALIDSLEIDFQEGFNAITGETGAGKSILIGALGLLLGGRASVETIRKGKKRSFVEGVFTLGRGTPLACLLNDAGVTAEEGELIVRREINAEGANKCFMNATRVPLSLLARAGSWLVDVHGQHEHQYLLDPDTHIHVVDAAAECAEEAASYRKDFRELREKEQYLASVRKQEAELASRAEYNAFLLEELRNAALTENEEQELKDRLAVLANAENISRIRTAVSELLDQGEHNLCALVSRLTSELEELAHMEKSVQELVSQAHEARIIIEDLASSINRSERDVFYDPQEVELCNERLQLISRLKKKHQTDLPGLIGLAERLAKEIDLGENFEHEIRKLEKELETCRAGAVQKAARLSRRRKTAARKLDESITRAFADLGMDGAEFKTRIEPAGDLHEDGADTVEFLVASNAGEDFLPVRKTASGGEISRIMLAIKNSIAENDRVPTVVFDEIDIGIGGITAHAVGEYIASLSRHCQVLCITHLHQIASLAAHHYAVRKTDRNGRVVTGIAHLSREQRVNELARMMGDESSERVRSHAESLIR